MTACSRKLLFKLCPAWVEWCPVHRPAVECRQHQHPGRGTEEVFWWSKCCRMDGVEKRAPKRTYQEWTAPSRNAPPAFMSERELAFVLGISVRSIRNYVARGLIPRIKIGRRVLFRWATVQSALAAMEGRSARGRNQGA